MRPDPSNIKRRPAPLFSRISDTEVVLRAIEATTAQAVTAIALALGVTATPVQQEELREILRAYREAMS